MDSNIISLWKIKDFFKKLSQSIGFIPAIMGITGVLLVVLLSYIEELGVTDYLVNRIPYLLINNQDTASTVLSYLSAGIISIMVFSFSMVMVLLNQAASNFSPRVIPGLISVRKHQVIIGLYLGTLLYNTFIMIGLKPVTDQFNLPSLSILIGIMLTIACLFSFIYFIDSISKSIQVHSILERIYSSSKKKLLALIEEESEKKTHAFNTVSWTTYPTIKSGYIRSINEDALLDFCNRNNCKIKTLQINGAFVTRGMKLFLCSKALEEDQVKEVLEFISINRKGENVNNNYILGFKQITEIGIKAMSPGINDPGTAITTIDYLAELFSIRMAKKDQYYIYNLENQPLIEIRVVSFKELLTQVMMTYRQYCKHDMSCSQKLILMLTHLQHHPNCDQYKTSILDEELKKLITDLKHNIENKEDLDVLLRLVYKQSEVMPIEEEQ